MDYSKRIDAAYTQIGSVKNKVVRRDLLVMLRSTEAAYTKLDKESVECRRLKKETLKYRELLQNFEELLTHLEKHITFANLVG
jgi:hypothetical protein